MSDETKTDATDEQANSEAPLNITQSQLDALIKDRLNQQAKKFGDYDSVKEQAETLAAQLKEREDADLSEAEKRQKRIDELEAINTELKKHEEWRTNWELKEVEKIEAEMAELSDTQKTIINNLPLEQRFTAISEFKAVSSPPDVNTDKGTKFKAGFPTREEVEKLKNEFGAQSAQFKESYKKYMESQGVNV